MEFNRKNVRTILGIAAFCILFAWALKNLHLAGELLRGMFRFLAPFLMGGAIAFILNIPMKSIERRLFPRTEKAVLVKLRRPLAIVLTLLALFGVLALILLIVLPELIETVRRLVVQVPGFFQEVQAKLMPLVGGNTEAAEFLNNLSLDWQEILKSLLDWLQNGAGSFLSGTMTAATSIVSGVVDFFIGFVFAIYVLAQRERLSRQTKMILYALLPERAADYLCRVGVLACRVFSSFFSGQCLEACILGLLFVISMTIFRMPYAVLVGVLVAFTALIPLFGAFIGCALGAFLILVQNPIQALWFIVMFIVIQQLEGNLIYPRVVGNSVGLPSIWVLAAVTLGGSTMGVMGMLVMIPVCSVAYTLLREAIYGRLKRRGVAKDKLEPARVPPEPKPEAKPEPAAKKEKRAGRRQR